MALSLEHNFTPYYAEEGQNVLDEHLHFIRGTKHNVANRFFDKPYTILVDQLARAGATGEHSPCDALVPSIVAEYGIVQGVEEDAFASPDTAEFSTAIGGEDGLTRVDWVTDEKLWNECKDAKRRSTVLIEDSDDSVLWFTEYGTDWIKGVGTYFIPSRCTG
jgi:carnitine O-acetyltransferase